MTMEEKKDLVIADALACVKQILDDKTDTLSKAKWLAASHVQVAHVISTEGRVPSSEEIIEWMQKQPWAFVFVGAPR